MKIQELISKLKEIATKDPFAKVIIEEIGERGKDIGMTKDIKIGYTEGFVILETDSMRDSGDIGIGILSGDRDDIRDYPNKQGLIDIIKEP